MNFLRAVMLPLLRIYIRSRYELRVRNREVLSGLDSPVIFVSNHEHLIDTMIYKSILGRHFYVCGARKVYFSSYIKRFIMKLGLVVPFSSEDEFPEVCLELLRKKKSILLYPEMTTKNRMQKFEIYAARIACRANIPVIPVRIAGTTKKGGVVRVNFGHPIEGYSSMSETQLNTLFFTSVKSL